MKNNNKKNHLNIQYKLLIKMKIINKNKNKKLIMMDDKKDLSIFFLISKQIIKNK